MRERRPDVAQPSTAVALDMPGYVPRVDERPQEGRWLLGRTSPAGLSHPLRMSEFAIAPDALQSP